MTTNVGTQRPTASYDFKDVLARQRTLPFQERITEGAQHARQLMGSDQPMWSRQVVREHGREVEVLDKNTGEISRCIMFGSNSYLSLANHPYVVERVRETLELHGAGTGGPPAANGSTHLHRQLEERLAALKGTEDAILVPSGYSANVGLMSALITNEDLAVIDEFTHTSLRDGLKLAGVQQRVRRFRHNDPAEMEAMLAESARDRFVVVEGIYSVEGDVAPLDRIVPICKQHGATLVLDDAHATGVLGDTGLGSAEHFGVHGDVDLTVTTFGKAFGVIGAGVSGPSDVIQYLRFFARSVFYSTALPTTVVSAVLAGLDLLEKEPERREHLQNLSRYTTESLRRFGLIAEPGGAVIAVRVPEWMDAKLAVSLLAERQIFLTYVMYPVVAAGQQRFRISLNAELEMSDIDRLVEAFDEVWDICQRHADGLDQ